MSNKILFLIAVILFANLSAAGQTSDVSEINSEQAQVLQKWLAAKPNLRLANEQDYTRDALDFVRQSEGISFVPYYLKRDFNGDRKDDFAVILTAKDGEKTFAIAVFNAPFGEQPAFFSTKIEPDDVLYFNQNTKRLLVGPYASDAGFALNPSGKTYQAKMFNY